MSRRRVRCTRGISLLLSQVNPTSLLPKHRLKPHTIQSLSLDDVSELYLLDFVGSQGFVQEVSLKVPHVVVLDHHKTAVGRVFGGENVTGVVDMERSGAIIAFDYFRGKFGGKEKEFDGVRRVFEYTEDGDLWRWKLPESKAFSCELKDLNLEYDVGLNPSIFQQLICLDLESLISQGAESLSEKEKLIDQVVSESYEIALGDSVSWLRSDIGHQLATKSLGLNLRGIGAVVYRVPDLDNDEMLKISLRCVDIEDTTPISQEFGGGGHRAASSFMLDSAEFEQWKVGCVSL